MVLPWDKFCHNMQETCNEWTTFCNNETTLRHMYYYFLVTWANGARRQPLVSNDVTWFLWTITWIRCSTRPVSLTNLGTTPPTDKYFHRLQTCVRLVYETLWCTCADNPIKAFHKDRGAPCSRQLHASNIDARPCIYLYVFYRAKCVEYTTFFGVSTYDVCLNLKPFSFLQFTFNFNATALASDRCKLWSLCYRIVVEYEFNRYCIWNMLTVKSGLN